MAVLLEVARNQSEETSNTPDKQGESPFYLTKPQLFDLLYSIQFEQLPEIGKFPKGFVRDEQLRLDMEIRANNCLNLALAGDWEQATASIGSIHDGVRRAQTCLSLVRMREKHPSASSPDSITADLLAEAIEAADMIQYHQPHMAAHLFLDIASVLQELALYAKATLDKASVSLHPSFTSSTLTDAGRMELFNARIRREEMEAADDISRDKIRAILTQAINYFTEIQDPLRVYDLAPYADYFFGQYAEAYSIGEALRKAEEIAVGETKTAALFGIAVNAATTDHSSLSTIIQLIMQGVRRNNSPWQLGGAYSRSLPALVKKADLQPFADELIETMADVKGHPNKSSALLAEKARFLAVSLTAWQDDSVDPEVKAWLKAKSENTIGELVAITNKIEEEREINWHDAYNLPYVYFVLASLGYPMQAAFVQLAEKVADQSRIMKFPLPLDRIISYMTRAGYLSDAYQASFNIDDPRRRTAIRMEILQQHLAHHPEPINGEVIAMDDLLALAAIPDTETTQDPEEDPIARHARAFGYYSHLQSQEVLDVFANEPLAPSLILNFLIGRAQANWREWDKKNPLASAVSYLREKPVPPAVVGQFIDSLRETQDYHTNSTQLFALLNHSREKDYAIVYPDTFYPAEIIAGLLKIENPKALTLAKQLLVNKKMAETQPEVRSRLFELMFSHGYWSEELREQIIKRSQADGPNQKYLEFLAYLAYHYNLACTPQILDIIEPPDAIQPGVDKMLERTEKIYNYAARFQPMSPADWAQTLLADPQYGPPAYYVRHSGKYPYGHIPDYPYKTYLKTIAAIASLEIEQSRYDRLQQHLRATGMEDRQIQQIMQTLAEGRYPFERKKVRQVFSTQPDLVFEQKLYQESLQNLRWQLWAVALANLRDWDVDSLSKIMDKAREDNEFTNFDLARQIDRIVFDLEESLTISSLRNFIETRYGTEKNWRTELRRHILRQINPQNQNIGDIAQTLLNEVDFLLENLERLEQQRIPAAGSSKKYTVEFVEKGKEPIRFARSVDGVAQCVNTTEIGPHVDYMSRRLVDPTSFAVDITDQNGKIIGGVDMRVGINPETELMELFCVGIYSAGKSESFIYNILQFIEQSIALPLKLAAINIASVYGGRIERPFGYVPVEDRVFIAYSPVINRTTGEFVRSRGDDIIQDYDYREEPKVDYNGPFSFSGYRKELPR